MAINDIAGYAHLSAADIAALGNRLDSVRYEVESSRGEKDAAYIRRAIGFQRVLDVAARLMIHTGRGKLSALAGTVALATAKSIENMEIGHNVCHGQWDWMNDPEIHSTTWEWDMAGSSAQWRTAHNFHHHVYTNVVGMDDDLGFDFIRVSRDQHWQPRYLLLPLQNLLLALTFEWGIALHDLETARNDAPTAAEKSARTRIFALKAARQIAKDYVVLPALSGRRWRRALTANAAANILRNLWAYVVIFCGHFPDGAEKFTPAAIAHETKGEWYLRQILGTANFNAGRVLAFMSGHLCHQIEHHLFPDLPSNRYPEIAARVKALCEEYDLPYTTGSLARQYLLTWRTIHKLALPDMFLKATADDAPETASERKFWIGGMPATDGQRGLRTALRDFALPHRR